MSSQDNLRDTGSTLVDSQLNNISSHGTNSLPNSPTSAPVQCGLSFSPASRRRRLRNVSKRNIDALLGISPTRHVPHIPRDPIQPSSGSISDVHGEASVDEETDFFSDKNMFRARSNTCPENRLSLRKSRVQNRNRPLTPPPGGADDNEIEHQLSKMAIKEKLHIRDVSSPPIIPIGPQGNDEGGTNKSLDNYMVALCNGQRPCDIVNEEDETVFLMED